MRQIFRIGNDLLGGLTHEEVDATVTAMRECGVYALPFIEDIFVRFERRAFGALVYGVTGAEELGDWDKGNGKTMGGDVPLIEVNISEHCGELERFYLRNVVHKHLRARYVASISNPNRRPLNGEPLLGDRDIENRTHSIMTTGEDFVNLCDPRWRISGEPEHSPWVRNTDAVVERVRDVLVVLLASRGIRKEVTSNYSKARALMRKPQKPNADTVTTYLHLSERRPSEGRGGTHAAPRMHMRRGHRREQRYGKGNLLTRQVFIEPVWINADADFMVTRTAYKIVR